MELKDRLKKKPKRKPRTKPEEGPGGGAEEGFGQTHWSPWTCSRNV